MDLKARVMSGLRWRAAMRFISQLFTWVVTIYVMRLLSPSDYGLMSMAFVFIDFLAMFGELGLGFAIVHRRDLGEAELKAILGFVLGVSLLFCCLLALFAPLIAGFYSEPRLQPILYALSLMFLLSGLGVVPGAILLREQGHARLAVIEMVSLLTGSITTLLMAVNGMKVWSLVGGVLMVRLVNLVGLHLFRPFVHLPRFTFRGMGPVISFSWKVPASRFMWFIYTNAATTLFIGKLLGKETLGFYSVGLYLASLPMEKVSGIINSVALPAFASIQNDRGLALRHFLKAVRILTMVSIPVFWGISSIATEIIGVFLGDKWSPAALPVQIIALAVPLRMVRNLMMPALVGLGRTDVNLSIELVAVVVMTLSFYVGTYWGLAGVSLVWVVIFPLVFALNVVQMSKVLGKEIWAVVKSMQWPVLAGMVMFGAVEWTRSLVVATDLGLVSRMVLLIAVGAGAYISVMLLVNRRGIAEILSLVRA